MLDHIKAVNTPNLDRLMAEGTTGSSSILGHPTISAPSWSTILTGVWNAEHGVQDNSFAGARYDQYPSAFTQIERTDPGRPDFIFTQVDQVDGAGHWTGTLGPAYNQAVEAEDIEVGRIVAAVDQRQRDTGEGWTVLVTADHGHLLFGGHGGQTPDEASTFVIARGDGYQAGGIDNGYTIADITPTVLETLGVPRPANLDGKPLARSVPLEG